jgi:hypothetical protein
MQQIILWVPILAKFASLTGIDSENHQDRLNRQKGSIPLKQVRLLLSARSAQGSRQVPVHFYF